MNAAAWASVEGGLNTRRCVTTRMNSVTQKWAGHLDTDALIELADGFVEFDNRCCAVLTGKGRRNPLARQCLESLGQSTRAS